MLKPLKHLSATHAATSYKRTVHGGKKSYKAMSFYVSKKFVPGIKDDVTKK
jgi:hypothetical protein